MDFQFDATTDGRRLEFLNVIDEHSRFCLAIRVGRRCKAKDVVAVLEELTSLYPPPSFIRSDNGPEFIAQSLRSWCEASGTTTSYIETSSCSQQLRRPRSWPTGGTGSTTPSGRIRPSRGIRPWRQLNRELQPNHDHPLS
jgi:transposase InsO family protein